MRKQLWGREFRKDGYFVRMVGDRVTTRVITKYIWFHEESKKRPRAIAIVLRNSSAAGGDVYYERRSMMESAKVSIDEVTVYKQDLPLRHIYQHSAAKLTQFRQVYLRLENSSGVLGYAEVRGNCPYVTHEVRKDIVCAIREQFIPLVRVFKGCPAQELISNVDKNITSQGARTLINVALHDLVAKERKMPVYDLLGGKILDEVPGYCGVPFGDERRSEEIAKYGVEQGFQLFKVRVGVKSLEEDLRRLEIVRGMIGDRDLAVDVNRAWSVEEAIKSIRVMSRFNLVFVEQPVESDDIKGMKTVREAVDVPIMADESLSSLASLNKLIESEAVDMVNIKMLKAGGITGVCKAIEAAYTHEIPFLFGAMSTGILDTAATLQVQCSIGAKARYFSGGIGEDTQNDPATGLEMHKGRLKVPDGPGLGVSIDERLLSIVFSQRV